MHCVTYFITQINVFIAYMAYTWKQQNEIVNWEEPKSASTNSIHNLPIDWPGDASCLLTLY
jgi:hypothetical protein